MIGLPTLRNTTYKPKERNVLDLFTVEGEGGYKGNQYTFMFKSSAFFNNDILSTVKSVMADDTKIKNVVFQSQTFNYRDSVLRIVLGNNNQCIIYRDGSIDIGGKNTQFPALANIIPQIRDTFCPSSYAGGGNQYQQIFLLENGDLILVNVYTKTITTLLTGVQKFINKNQAHKCDTLVGLKNGDVYQVWCGPTPTKQYGNGTASGINKINNINHNDIKFCTIGDPPASSSICFKNETNKLYKFIRGNGTDFKISGIENSPIITLNSDEYFVDGMSAEFNMLLITNKKMYCKYAVINGSTWTNAWEKDLYPINPTINDPIIKAKKIVTPTSYSMIVEDSDGKYWLCAGTSWQILNKPVAYTFFDTLKVNLEPIRESS